jgi:chromatin segregation and condensation protein Rec8/ScpA/Scc1 (kleisin family)
MYSKSDFDPSSMFLATPAERRAAMERADQERAEARRRELDEQTSMNNDPRQRIQIWERLHALQLPVTAAHPLVSVIAKQTNLTIREINDEQQRRSAPKQTAAV